MTVIAGDLRLPAGFAHPPASEQARQIAERGTILRVQVGWGCTGLPSRVRTIATRWESVSSRQSSLPASREFRPAPMPMAGPFHSSSTNDTRSGIVPAVSRIVPVPAMSFVSKLRLGVPGVEPLRTGRITLPIPEPHLSYLRSVRRGEVALAEVTQAVSDAGAEVRSLAGSSGVADEPDRGWVGYISPTSASGRSASRVSVQSVDSASSINSPSC